MKPVRRGAYALLFILSLLVSLIVSPGVAKAWSGYLPQCGNFPTTWMSAIESDPRFNADTAWVAFKRDWSGPPFRGSPALAVVWSPPANQSHRLSLVGNGVDITANGLRIPSGASLYRVFDDSLVGVTSSSSGYSYTTTYDVNCIQDTHQIHYMNWVGYRYSDSVANSQGPSEYVALGDSFSSGEGNPPFEDGTDVSSENECHRSSLGYPRLLQNDPDLNLGITEFVACSAATTANVQNGGQWNEPTQLNALAVETEVVTLTIGGNDVGFSDYVLGCVVACGPGTPIYTSMMNGINQPAFKANLVYTFEDILDAAPNADLYVADYPYLADENATTCQGLDFSGAYDVQEALNGVIHDAAMEVGLTSNRIFVVETNYPNSPFEGGHLCNGGTSLFNGVVLPSNAEYSLHPNAAGQAAYAQVFKEYIDS